MLCSAAITGFLPAQEGMTGQRRKGF